MQKSFDLSEDSIPHTVSRMKLEADEHIDVDQLLSAMLSGAVQLDRERLFASSGQIERLFSADRRLDRQRSFGRLLYRVGESVRAGEAFEPVLKSNPADPEAIIFVSAAAEAAGRKQRALALLDRLDLSKAPFNVLMRAASLRATLGDEMASLEAAQEAMKRFPDKPGSYAHALRLVADPDQRDTVLRAGLRNTTDIPLAFQILRSLAPRRGHDPRWQHVLKHFSTITQDHPQRYLWLARRLRLEGSLDEAKQALERYLGDVPGDRIAAQELTDIAIQMRRWGADAKVIAAGLERLDFDPNIRSKCRVIDQLFRDCGGSLAEAAADPDKFADISTPATPMRLIAERTPPTAIEKDRSGLVMIGGSLAAGGAERIMAQTFRQFREMNLVGGVELWLFQFRDDESKQFYVPLTGLMASDIVELASPDEIRPPFSYFPEFMANKAQAIYNLLVKRRPLVVHASLDCANLCAAAAAVLAGVPRIIMHAHNMRPMTLMSGHSIECFGWDLCYRSLLEREEIVLVNCSQAGLDDYLAWTGSGRRDRTRVIHNGFDFSAFDDPPCQEELAQMRRELGIPAGSPIVGTAIRFEPVKRPDRWLETARIVHKVRPDVHFVLFGDGSQRDASRNYADQLGLRRCVHLPGRVSDLHRRLPLFDLFVLSSSSEGLPNVLLEAQAAGVPVVSYDVGGAAETMDPGRTGLLARDDTAEALASCILAALGNAEWMNTASRLGRELVRERFSLERMIHELAQVIQGVA